MSSPSPLLPGSLGPYRVLRELGAGATARVYEAEHEALRKRVAIKLLLPRGSVSRERFLREGRAAARVRHPNVVDIFDVGSCELGPFLVLELLDGGTLASRIPEPGAADVESALAWLLPVIAAVAAAHEAGVIHRDLKPSNLLVAFDARGGLVPKVADFGVSKLADDARELTGSEGLLGTPSYMAPEQMRDPRSAGPAADQYSLGVLLYLFLSGHLPHDAPSALALMNLVVSTAPAPLDRRNPAVPPALAAVVARALDRDPTRRFPSVRALGVALLPFASGRTRAQLEREWEAPDAPPPAPPLAPGDATCDDAAQGDTLDDRAPELPARGAEPPSQAPRSRPRAWALAGLAAAGLAAALLRGRERPAQGFFAEATEPRSSAPAAAQAYRLGLSAMRDSAWEAGIEHFEQATRLDPELGAAHLRLAMAIASPEPQARRALSKARVLRDTLSERDRVFLEALEPLYFQDPPDHAAHVARLRAGLLRFPRDAELTMHLAIALQAPPTWPEARRLAERALELSPGYPDALQTRARALAAGGDAPAALAELARCVELAPLAVGCLRAQANLLESAGRCAEMPPGLRRWMSVDPRSFEPQLRLAGLLAREARPWQAIEEIMLQRWARSSPEDRPTRERKDRARLALHRGLHAEALPVLEELNQLWIAAQDEETDEWAIERRLFALERLALAGPPPGRADRARELGRVALEFLARTEGRVPRPSLVDNGRLRAVAAAVQAGALSLDEGRPRALAAAGLSPGAAGPRALVELLLARTASEAQAALDALGATEVPDDLAADHARVLALAGRADLARARVTDALRGCDGLALPYLRAAALDR